MEFSSPSSVPIILHHGGEKDWGHQCALEHTLRWTETKQTGSLPLRRSSVLSTKRRVSQPDAARVEKRRRINKPVVITKQRSPIEKSKSTGDWELLLKSSLERLQGLYEKVDAPVIPKSQVLGDRFPLGLVASDPVSMTSKAMHHAAGCCSEGGIDEDDSYNSSASEAGDSSDSDMASEGPSTPDATHFNDDVDIDIDFGSG